MAGRGGCSISDGALCDCLLEDVCLDATASAAQKLNAGCLDRTEAEVSGAQA